jgi:hypothetical protein
MAKRTLEADVEKHSAVGENGSPSKRRKQLQPQASHETVISGDQLKQLLNQTSDVQLQSGETKKSVLLLIDRRVNFILGIQSFRKFLTAFEDEDTKDQNKRVLEEFLQSQRPKTDEDSFLSKLMASWVNFAQTNVMSLQSSIASFLTILLKTISSILDFRIYGTLLCKAVLQLSQLRVLARGLSSGREFIVSSYLKLLTQVVLFNGGSSAREVYAQREFTFAKLPQNLAARVRVSKKKDDKARNMSNRKPALDLLLANFQVQDTFVKDDLAKQSQIIGAMLKDIGDDPPEMIDKLLDTLKEAFLSDTKVLRGSKTRVFSAWALSRIAGLYNYVPNSAKPSTLDIPLAAHKFLLYATTTPDLGILIKSNRSFVYIGEAESKHKKSSFTLKTSSSTEPREIPVHNKTLAAFIPILRPWNSKLQADLVMAIFTAAPELVARYFKTIKFFPVEADLSSTWMGASSFLFSIMQMPITDTLKLQSPKKHDLPSQNVLLEHILPSPLTEKILLSYLRSKTKLISFFGVRLLLNAFTKLKTINEAISATDKDCNRLENENWDLIEDFSKRIPPLKETVSLFWTLLPSDYLQREATVKLISLYFSVTPSLIGTTKFDISSVLENTLASLQVPNTAQDMAFTQLTAEHMLKVASISPSVRWTSRTGSMKLSLYSTLLKSAITSPDRSFYLKIRKHLWSVNTHTVLFRQQPEELAFESLAASLRLVSKADELEHIFGLLDNAVVVFTRKNFALLDKYSDNQALSKGSEPQYRPISMICYALADQWPHFVASEAVTDSYKLVAARWLSRYLVFSAVAGENYQILAMLADELKRAATDDETSHAFSVAKAYLDTFQMPTDVSLSSTDTSILTTIPKLWSQSDIAQRLSLFEGLQDILGSDVNTIYRPLSNEPKFLMLLTSEIYLILLAVGNTEILRTVSLAVQELFDRYKGQKDEHQISGSSEYFFRSGRTDDKSIFSLLKLRQATIMRPIEDMCSILYKVFSHGALPLNKYLRIEIENFFSSIIQDARKKKSKFTEGLPTQVYLTIRLLIPFFSLNEVDSILGGLMKLRTSSTVEVFETIMKCLEKLDSTTYQMDPMVWHSLVFEYMPKLGRTQCKLLSDQPCLAPANSKDIQQSLQMKDMSQIFEYLNRDRVSATFLVNSCRSWAVQKEKRLPNLLNLYRSTTDLNQGDVFLEIFDKILKSNVLFLRGHSYYWSPAIGQDLQVQFKQEFVQLDSQFIKHLGKVKSEALSDTTLSLFKIGLDLGLLSEHAVSALSKYSESLTGSSTCSKENLQIILGLYKVLGSQQRKSTFAHCAIQISRYLTRQFSSDDGPSLTDIEALEAFIAVFGGERGPTARELLQVIPDQFLQPLLESAVRCKFEVSTIHKFLAHITRSLEDRVIKHGLLITELLHNPCNPLAQPGSPLRLEKACSALVLYQLSHANPNTVLNASNIQQILVFYSMSNTLADKALLLILNQHSIQTGTSIIQSISNMSFEERSDERRAIRQTEQQFVVSFDQKILGDIKSITATATEPEELSDLSKFFARCSLELLSIPETSELDDSKPHPEEVDAPSTMDDNDIGKVASPVYYDPDFVIPLFVSATLGNGPTLEISSFVEGNCLSYIMIHLSSPIPAKRSLARTSLLIIAENFRQSKYKEASSLVLLIEETLEAASQIKDSQLPLILGSFSARAAKILVDPLHFLYGKINEFLNRGPVWELHKVPLLRKILVSKPGDERTYYEQVGWMLEMLEEGISSPADVDLYIKADVFELVMSMYSCGYLASRLKEKILSLLVAASFVPSAAKLLDLQCGIMTWLQENRGVELEGDAKWTCSGVHELLGRRLR